MKTIHPPALIAILAGMCPAATHTVANLDEAGAGSLRQAIDDADPADTIVFGASLDGGTITLGANAQLEVGKSLTIDATALPNGLTISGNNTWYVFWLKSSSSAVTFRGLTMRDGLNNNQGGAIQNSVGATLTVEDCRFLDNTANQAGAIYHKGDTLTIRRCEFIGNQAIGGGGGGEGGAIWHRDGNNSLIEDCRFSGNSAYNGGALSHDAVLGRLELRRSTLHGNTAEQSGGAIVHDGNFFTLMDNFEVIHCTISNNTAQFSAGGFGGGGGIYNDAGKMILRSCTITLNTAPAGQGSGVASYADSTTVSELRNCIACGNTNTDLDTVGAGSSNSFASAGHNLVGDGDGIGDFGAAGDVTGVTDPLLGPLQDNGGPTMTHAPLAGSPAFDTGDSLESTDQRGEGRPWGAADDRGALEIQGQLLWGANFGWAYWQGDIANDAAVNEYICSGHLWSGNFGWIVLGDGTPENGHQYENNSATDCGVNLADFTCPSPGVLEAELRGFAWGANFGWINFEDSGDARIDLQTGKLRGYAWAPNLGWINLGETHASLNVEFASIPDAPDSDMDGIADPYEMLHAGDLVTMNALTDSDMDGTSDVDEYAADTDPFNPLDKLRIVSVLAAATPGEYDLTFTSRKSRLYQFYGTDDLLPAGWLETGPLVYPEGATTTTTVEDSGSIERHFWRVSPRRPLAPSL